MTGPREWRHADGCGLTDGFRQNKLTDFLFDHLDVLLSDPLSPTPLSEIVAEGRELLAEAMEMGWPKEMPTTEALHKFLRRHAVALLDAAARLSSAPAPVPEPWVTYGPTGRRYRVNVDLLSDGDRMPFWLTADLPDSVPVSPSVDPEDFAECDHCGGPLNAARPEENPDD